MLWELPKLYAEYAVKKLATKAKNAKSPKVKIEEVTPSATAS